MAVPVAGIAVTGIGAAAGVAYLFRDKLKALITPAKKSNTVLPPAPGPVPPPSPPNTPKVIVPPPPAPPSVTPPVPVPAPKPTESGRSWAIALTNVNTRAAMGTSAPLVSPNDAFKDRMVEILDWNAGTKDGYDWAKVVTPGGATGYAAKKYLQPTDGRTAPVPWTPTYQERKDLHAENMQEQGGTYRPYLEVAVNGEFGKDNYSNPTMTAAKQLYAILSGRIGGDLTSAVKAFQRAHNKNRKALGIGIKLTENGVYTPATSAALTQYTGAPIAADPRHRAREASLGEVLTTSALSDTSNAGSAKLAQFNLKTYLSHYGANYGDPNFVLLVREFQHAVNTDPLFPGVSYRIKPAPKKLLPELPVTGSIDPATAFALNA